MTRVTRFADRDPGPAARLSGFMAHLRENGMRIGVAEADLGMTALTHVDAADPVQARMALKAVCTGCGEDAARFDDLFDAYWLNGGRVSPRVMPSDSPHVHARRTEAEGEAQGVGSEKSPGGGSGEAEADGEGKLVATEVENLMRRDLRDLVTREGIAAAEVVARRLGAALRDRRSRRRRTSPQGDRLHFRKLIRQSIATGGEPLKLPKTRRPDRTPKIAALCDVSGSMSVYAQVFLAFLAGLLRADSRADAYIFHTKLVRITEALRDKDAMRALTRLSLMADGFAGGSKIGSSLDRFANTYARRFVDGHTVVLILSDGYDTDPAEGLSKALEKLKKRGCKVIWLNPLKGWHSYAPVAGGMAAAMPHLDLFAAAGSLNDLAALEPELSRL